MPRSTERKDIRKEIWLTRSELKFIQNHMALEGEYVKTVIEKIVRNKIERERKKLKEIKFENSI